MHIMLCQIRNSVVLHVHTQLFNLCYDNNEINCIQRIREMGLYITPQTNKILNHITVDLAIYWENPIWSSHISELQVL